MNNLLNIIIPMPIRGSGASTELIVALFIVSGILAFLPSLVWLIVDYVRMKRKHNRCFHDWWHFDIDFLPLGVVSCYLFLAFVFLIVELAFKITPLL